MVVACRANGSGCPVWSYMVGTMRILLCVVLLFVVFPVAAQRDTTPYNCERLTVAKTGSWAAPIFRDVCERQEASDGEMLAKLRGQPRPSAKVYEVPERGSVDTVRTGISCIGGTVMQRVENGWVQLRDRDNRWLRCRGD